MSELLVHTCSISTLEVGQMKRGREGIIEGRKGGTYTSITVMVVGKDNNPYYEF